MRRRRVRSRGVRRRRRALLRDAHQTHPKTHQVLYPALREHLGACVRAHELTRLGGAKKHAAPPQHPTRNHGAQQLTSRANAGTHRTARHRARAAGRRAAARAAQRGARAVHGRHLFLLGWFCLCSRVRERMRGIGVVVCVVGMKHSTCALARRRASCRRHWRRSVSAQAAFALALFDKPFAFAQQR